MSNILVACDLIILFLALYSIGFYFYGAVFIFDKPVVRRFSEYPQDLVSVLIPGRNEGMLSIQAIQSILAQDHIGGIDIYLLIKDLDDSSIEFLIDLYAQESDNELSVAFKYFKSQHVIRPSNRLIKVHTHGNKTLFVALTGIDPKSEKINWVVNFLATPFVAILDCDHWASSDWIRTSLILMSEQKAQMVQSRRRPFHMNGFFGFWDSLQQHIGNELFNIAFTNLGLTIFFTGSTALMQTSLLKNQPFSSSITEDTEYSYYMFVNGLKIILNPYSESHEETSPDLYSFLARRRRWASGHTDAFFQYLFKLINPYNNLGSCIQFLFHGTHYLIVVSIFLLQLLIGIYYFYDLNQFAKFTSICCSFIFAALIVRHQNKEPSILKNWSRFYSNALEFFVLFAWFSPAVTLLTVFLDAILTGDLTSVFFPAGQFFKLIGVIALLAPIITLTLGLIRFNQFTFKLFIKCLITYPFSFYLNISGILLGLCDYLRGHNHWRVVNRSKINLKHVSGNISTVDLLLNKVNLFNSYKKYQPMTRLILFLSIILFIFGILYHPSKSITNESLTCYSQIFDDLPWILSPKKRTEFCEKTPQVSKLQGMRSGEFKIARTDNFNGLDTTYWDRMNTTFFCNQAAFSPDNVVISKQGGLNLNIEHKSLLNRQYTAADITTKDSPDKFFKFGRFETVFKPVKVDGVISSFFLYRFDPWQEIDAEFLGKDTTKLLVNVFYNPGEEGDLYNYGLRGTPVLIDLGFDASMDFHRYAIEWERDEVRWFVDDKLIHVRKSGYPTPIPNLPMRFHVNTWPICSEELAGKFAPKQEVISTELKSVSIFQWVPPPQNKIIEFINSFF